MQGIQSACLDSLKERQGRLIEKGKALVDQLNIDEIEGYETRLIGHLNASMARKSGTRLNGWPGAKREIRTQGLRARKRGEKTTKPELQVEIALWFQYRDNDDDMSGLLNLIYMIYDYALRIKLTESERRRLEQQERIIKDAQEVKSQLDKVTAEIKALEEASSGSDTASLTDTDDEMSIDGTADNPAVLKLLKF